MWPPTSLRWREAGRPRGVVLVGLSGSGKSTVARLLAERLGWDLVDTDAEIERATGMSVRTLFANRGEAAFRALERQAVARACEAPGRVIATGGGAVLDEANRRDLWGRNLVVYLRTSVDTLVERLDGVGDDRPLLAGDRRARLQALQQERAALYADADAVIDTDGRTPDEVASQIMRLL